MKNDEYASRRIEQVGERGYIEGKGEVLRAARMYLGLSKYEMAAKLRIADRSYQRMETGERPIPPAFMDQVDRLIDEFDDAVELLIGRAEKAGDLVIEVSRDHAEQWKRSIVGRAAIESRRITPVLAP